MRPIPPLYFLASIAAMAALHHWLPGPRWLEFPWNFLGLVPVLAGIVLAAYSARLFEKHQTAIRPFEPSKALVQEGPYRITRNPMYLGMVLCLFGLWILLGTTSPILVPPLFVLLIHFQFVRREEILLTERFGDAYKEYSRKVRRWI